MCAQQREHPATVAAEVPRDNNGPNARGTRVAKGVGEAVDGAAAGGDVVEHEDVEAGHRRAVNVPLVADVHALGVWALALAEMARPRPCHGDELGCPPALLGGAPQRGGDHWARGGHGRDDPRSRRVDESAVGELGFKIGREDGAEVARQVVVGARVERVLQRSDGCAQGRLRSGVGDRVEVGQAPVVEAREVAATAAVREDVADLPLPRRGALGDSSARSR